MSSSLNRIKKNIIEAMQSHRRHEESKNRFNEPSYRTIRQNTPQKGTECSLKVFLTEEV